MTTKDGAATMPRLDFMTMKCMTEAPMPVFLSKCGFSSIRSGWVIGEGCVCEWRTQVQGQS